MTGIVVGRRRVSVTFWGTVVVTSLICGALVSVGRAAGDVLLTGTITSAAGEQMEGVTVSARQVGTTFTTSVFTDAAGEYYFPRLEAGAYKLWAQAVGYDAAIVEDLSLDGPVHRQDAVLKPLQNFDLQLRGDEWLASLPTATDQDKRMKEVFRMTCLGGCHAPGHVLINRFDEQGWKNWIDLMSRINSTGTYSLEEDLNYAPIQHYFRDQLAAYLAKARGPVPSGVPLKPRPRPTGEEALAVFREYDTPLPGVGLPLYNDGSLWQLGPPNKTDVRNRGAVRGAVDAAGNPWFTNFFNPLRSVAKIDWQTGKLTNYRVVMPDGRFAGAGEIFGAFDGTVWTETQGGGAPHLVGFDRSGEMSLIKIPDRATVPPAVPGQRDDDWDGTPRVRVWWERPGGIRCADGVCENAPFTFWMYEPSTERWAVYENPQSQAEEARAFAEVYNHTSKGDEDGNGWWAQFATDVIVKADGRNPGKVYAFQVPNRDNPVWDLFEGDDRKIFEMVGGADPHGRGVPYRHSFRMVGSGPGPTDSAWVSGYFSADLIRINIRTHEMTVYDDPAGDDCFSYMESIDPEGMVWSICQSTDILRRFDPKTQRWSRFAIPSLNVDAHGMAVAPVLIDGRVRVAVPAWSNSKMIVMDVRTEEDVQALRAEAQRAGAQ